MKKQILKLAIQLLITKSIIMFKKIILSAFITGLFNDLLVLTKGAKAFNGHLTVDEVDNEKGIVSSHVDVNDSHHYKVTIERIK